MKKFLLTLMVVGTFLERGFCAKQPAKFSLPRRAPNVLLHDRRRAAGPQREVQLSRGGKPTNRFLEQVASKQSR
jgi:hypothetical protein